MNHQPFRDWLLSEEKLSTDQAQSLQDHLNTCDSCKSIGVAWNEVEATIFRTPLVIPAPGFTVRWQARFNEYQFRAQKRKSWMTIGYIAFVVISLLGFSITQIWALLQSPGPYLAAWFSRLVDLLSLYYSFEVFAPPISIGNPFYTFIAMFFLVGMISFMSVLWLATVRKFSLARRFA